MLYCLSQYTCSVFLCQRSFSDVQPYPVTYTLHFWLNSLSEGHYDRNSNSQAAVCANPPFIPKLVVHECSWMSNHQFRVNWLAQLSLDLEEVKITFTK